MKDLRAVKTFLQLFDDRLRSSLRRAIALSVAVALCDFFALLLLFPVLTQLTTSGGSSGDTVQLPVLGEQRPGVLIIGSMMLLVLRAVTGFLVKYWWSRRVAEAEVRLGTRVLRAYAEAPYRFHLGTNSSELLSRSVAHVNLSTNSALVGMVSVAVEATSALAMMAALFVASPVAALTVTAVLAVLAFLILVVSQRAVRRESELLGRRVSAVYVQAANVLRGIRELTVANGRATAVRGVESARREMVEAQRRVLILSEGPRLVLEVTLYASVLVALFLSLQSSDPSDTLPLIALYVVAAMRLVPGVARMLGIATQVRSSIEIGLTVLGELHELEEIGERHISPAGDLPDSGDLVLDGVSFEYVEGVDVLSEITLEVPRGEMVGIVGPSGSGKTTLVSVMLGLLPPTRGTVTFGGAAIGTADPSWMSRIAYVPQDVYIADASVRENVALGDDEPDDARVWSALARAHLDRVVREIPEGLDARLHEGGARLSVGQRQRLGIARALYRRAQVLLLDEPTAALDSITEGQVVGTLLELKGELTMIVVAHRLSTIADADRVVELKDGALTLVP